MNAPARRYTIVFDFDGTLLPSVPWDSEQTLLLARAQEPRPRWPLHRRLYGRLLALADRRGWLGGGFKMRYARLLRGTPAALIDVVAGRLAGRICEDTRRSLFELRARGHRLLVVSCGTADLSERVLHIAGVLPCFDLLLGNRFLFADGRIAGLRLEVPLPLAKLQAVRAAGLAPESTVAVGDGPTDLPLLRWAAVPVVVARGGRGKPPWVGSGWEVICRLSQLPEILRARGG